MKIEDNSLSFFLAVAPTPLPFSAQNKLVLGSYRHRTRLSPFWSLKELRTPTFPEGWGLSVASYPWWKWKSLCILLCSLLCVSPCLPPWLSTGTVSGLSNQYTLTFNFDNGTVSSITLGVSTSIKCHEDIAEGKIRFILGETQNQSGCLLRTLQSRDSGTSQIQPSTLRLCSQREGLGWGRDWL